MRGRTHQAPQKRPSDDDRNDENGVLRRTSNVASCFPISKGSRALALPPLEFELSFEEGLQGFPQNGLTNPRTREELECLCAELRAKHKAA